MIQKYIQENFTINSLLNTISIGTMLVFLWCFAGFTVDYFTYIKKGNYSIAETFDWGVVEFADDKYVVCVDFRFHTDGVEEYVSQYLFENTPYRYKEAANQAIEALRQQEIKCYWYGSSKDPTVSLERHFPLKSLIYSLIALFIYLYFIIMRRKFGKNDSYTN